MRSYGWGAATAAMLLTACGGGTGEGSSPSRAGSDPLAAYAWHLENSGPGQVVPAIDNSLALAGIDARVGAVHLGGSGITGRGVGIAVVDTGMQIVHEDLRANVLHGQSFNFLDGSADPSPDPRRADFDRLDHGTAVAGIAAAKGWNGLGSRGLAPNAAVVGYAPLNIPSRDVGVQVAMSLLKFGASGLLRPVQGGGSDAQTLIDTFGIRADSLDIFNFSAGVDFASPPQDPAALNLMTEAARYGTTSLRAGKGAVYVQSAGNGFRGSRSAYLQNGQVLPQPLNCLAEFAADYILSRFSQDATGLSCQDANFDVRGQPFFMKVAAISHQGHAASYSTAGAVNWVTGFGGEDGLSLPAILTTDDMGCDVGSNSLTAQGVVSWFAPELAARLNQLLINLLGPSLKDPDCNYTARMNGTSAAAPSVTGVVALLLEANPALSWLDVRYILAKTSRQVDPGIAAVTYTPAGASTPLVLSDAWVNNRGGFHFQSRYGFGLVDANAAVAMAQRYEAPTGRRLAPVSAAVASAVRNQAMPESSGRVSVSEQSFRFANGGDLWAGPMQVDLRFNNTLGRSINPGTLQFELLNTESGERSILMPAYTGWYVGGKFNPIPPQGSQDFRFFSNAFYGGSLSGNWTLRLLLLDGRADDALALSSETLTEAALVSHAF
jgi:subtilisin family serine protease